MLKVNILFGTKRTCVYKLIELENNLGALVRGVGGLDGLGDVLLRRHGDDLVVLLELACSNVKKKLAQGESII